MATRQSQHLRTMICQYAMRGGEELKRGLPTLVREAAASKVWEKEKKPNGEPFENLADWLNTPPPPGCGLGATPDAITYDDLADICEHVAPDVAKILRGARPKGKPGRKKADDTPHKFSRHGKSKNRETLAARLQQEHPKCYADFLAGKHKSLWAAAEYAGLVKPSNDPLARLKSNWRKASKSQRDEFRRWLRTKEAK